VQAAEEIETNIVRSAQALERQGNTRADVRFELKGGSEIGELTGLIMRLTVFGAGAICSILCRDCSESGAPGAEKAIRRSFPASAFPAPLPVLGVPSSPQSAIPPQLLPSLEVAASSS